MRKFSVALAAVSALAVAGAASAQDFKAGAQVVGKAGEVVGTVESADADTLTIKPAEGAAFGLPKAGFKADGDKVVAAWTKAEIDAARAQQAAKVSAEAGAAATAANVTAGLAVTGKDGAAVGTVDSVVAEAGALKTVMVKGEDGAVFGLPGAGFRVKDGAVVAAWTKADIDKARGATGAGAGSN